MSSAALSPSMPDGLPAHARPPATNPAHKLWGGRFAGGPTAALERLNRSIGTDFRLWPHDVKLSQAWAIALWQAGVLTLDESRTLELGLEAVGARIAAGVELLPSDEDVHTLIDRLLHEEVGDVASKLHTGRSRNDQVATAARLWTMEACERVASLVALVQRALFDQATALEADDVLMPSYTHLQRAQPVRAGHWALSHFWALERDRQRILSVARSASILPLGAGAIAGSAFPVDRVLLKELLGFHAIAPNSIDAVGDRDFVAETLFGVTLLGTHLSRLAEDLILFGSSEFGFVKFGDGFTTGSSMMPQKRNPDALELARGSAARFLGDLTALLVTVKGLPSGYNKDLQDDKRALFDAVDAAELVLPAVAGAVAELTFDADRMRAALASTMMATDLADWMVEQGITFREAHAAVGRLVREAEERGIELSALPAASFASAHPALGEQARESLSPERSVSRRGAIGGTAPEAVRVQIELARLTLFGTPEPARANELRAL